jgi:hypothetical protein
MLFKYIINNLVNDDIRVFNCSLFRTNIPMSYPFSLLASWNANYRRHFKIHIFVQKLWFEGPIEELCSFDSCIDN